MDPGDLPVVGSVRVFVSTVDEDAITFFKLIIFVLISEDAVSFYDSKKQERIQIIAVAGMFFYGPRKTAFLKIYQ